MFFNKYESLYNYTFYFDFSDGRPSSKITAIFQMTKRGKRKVEFYFSDDYAKENYKRHFVFTSSIIPFLEKVGLWANNKLVRQYFKEKSEEVGEQYEEIYETKSVKTGTDINKVENVISYNFRKKDE